MYDLVLQTSFFLGLGVVVYLLARAVPRVSDTGEPIHAPGAFDRALRKLPLEKIDKWLNALFEKILRKVRVMLLKLDNIVNASLGRLKKTNGKPGGSSLIQDKEMFHTSPGSDVEKE